MYFKVVEVQDDEDLNGLRQMRMIDPEYTKIIQSGSVTTPIPTYLNQSCTDTESGYGEVASELERLLKISLHPQSVTHNLFTSILISGAASSGKSELIRNSCQHVGLNIIPINCHLLLQDTHEATELMLNMYIQRAIESVPSMMLLQHLEAVVDHQSEMMLIVNMIPKLAAVLSDKGLPVVVAATVHELEGLPSMLSMIFGHRLVVEAPSLSDRVTFLKKTCKGMFMHVDLNLDEVGIQTAGLAFVDLQVSCISHTSMQSQD